MTTAERIAKCGIVPVIVIDDAANAVPTAKALLAGGIDVIEITFRTAAAPDAIAAVAKEVPEMLVGAGTIVTEQQLDAAIKAGACFIVSPGSDEAIIKAALEKNIPIVPGAVTPTEILIGLRHGLEVFKFFPCGDYGGLKTLKSLSGPFPQIKFMPTGGISEKNAAEYFAEKKIAAVGGSWMATKKMINDGQFDEITKKTAEAIAVMRSARAE